MSQQTEAYIISYHIKKVYVMTCHDYCGIPSQYTLTFQRDQHHLPDNTLKCLCKKGEQTKLVASTKNVIFIVQV